jgi:hypothetical protein
MTSIIFIAIVIYCIYLCIEKKGLQKENKALRELVDLKEINLKNRELNNEFLENLKS